MEATSESAEDSVYILHMQWKSYDEKDDLF